jgi:hypothetical protein
LRKAPSPVGKAISINELASSVVSPGRMPIVNPPAFLAPSAAAHHAVQPAADEDPAAPGDLRAHFEAQGAFFVRAVMRAEHADLQATGGRIHEASVSKKGGT